MFEAYINQAPIEHQKMLRQMYQLLKTELPEAQEKFSYGMPTFKGNKNLVHFSDNKKHVGFYPGSEVIVAFKEQLQNYQYSKGAVQFPYSQPLAEELIQQMVRLRKELDEA